MGCMLLYFRLGLKYVKNYEGIAQTALYIYSRWLHTVHMACPSTVRTQSKSLLKKFCSFLNRSFGTLKFFRIRMYKKSKKHNCQRIEQA
jgi:hypothetical protein